jgi:hypothetical protein
MTHKRHVSVKEDRSGLEACLREIWTASFWRKQHKKHREFEESRTRWKLPPLLWVGLAMSLDSKAPGGERFEAARDFVATVWEKRKRCGGTGAGFLKALAAVTRKWFGDVREQLQRHAVARDLKVARVGRWEAYGLDGTKQDVPRTEAHEDAYGLATKGPGAPQRQVVAAVALGKEVLWDWESGSALDSERELSLEVIRRLPLGSLAVCDAGFVGYHWCRAVQDSGRNFVVRVGANVRLWAEQVGKAKWQEDQVWLWPKDQERTGQAPLVLRLIRLERVVGYTGKGRRRREKREVLWLVTNVLDEERLTKEEARRLYGKRWPASEGTFRTWKRTLDKAKLYSRTPELAERESEFSLLGLILLEIMALTARKAKRDGRRRKVSVACAQQVWRRAVRETMAGKRTNWFREQMVEAMVDGYRRRKPKVRRRWPQRKEHNSFKDPNLLKLNAARKRCGLKCLQEEKPCAS